MTIRFLTLILLFLVSGSTLIFRSQVPSQLNSPGSAERSPINQQKKFDETHYLFDLVDHEPWQIQQLLERAELISKRQEVTSRIVFVIHGPDIEKFDKNNYGQNKTIIDLAAKLDATNVIDFKVCQVTADSRGINESSFPPFIELVPFAPDEIDRLNKKGYVEL